MHTLEIPEKGITLELPESLGECNRQQYVDVAFYLYQMANKEIDFHQFKMLSLYKLLGLEYVKDSSLPEEEQDNKDANLLMLSALIEDFFHKDEEGQVKDLKLDFLHNPVPVVEFEKKSYYGPTDFFQNITFGEYLEALGYFYKFLNPLEKEKADLELLEKEKENLFSRKLPYPDFESMMDEVNGRIEELKRTIYLETNKKSRYLRELFAVFYRPKRRSAAHLDNPQYDIRKPFNKYKVFQQSEKMVQLDPGILYGFFLLFFSFLSYLDQAQIEIDGNVIDLSLLFEKDSETSESVPGIGMLSVAFSLAQSQVFGDLEKVERTNFWKVILHLYDVKKKYLDEKSKLPSTEL